jgi:two-component system OmpR family response regulator
VVTAADGIQAIEVARREKPDLIILDVMLPGLDGFEVCRILRKEMAVPILMLTAKIEEIDKVVGLEVGADDYMTKPFSIRELMARVRAMLRRSRWTEPIHTPEAEAATILKINGLEVDATGHRISRNGTLLKLSPKEFDLLLFLMRHLGQVFNRELLVEKVWGYDYGGTARTVDVHIRSLRRKVEDDPEKPKHLMTIHGFGYKFEA